MADYSIFRGLVKSTLGVELMEEHKFHPSRKWRFDFAMISKKIAIEVEGGLHSGGRHTRATGYKKDMEKYNQAQLMGWKVYRFAPDQLLKSTTLTFLQQALQ